ncbi:hypothetical protein GCM10018952_51600 [Streptosporangium vulgare]
MPRAVVPGVAGTSTRSSGGAAVGLDDLAPGARQAARRDPVPYVVDGGSQVAVPLPVGVEGGRQGGYLHQTGKAGQHVFVPALGDRFVNSSVIHIRIMVPEIDEGTAGGGVPRSPHAMIDRIGG